LSGPDDVAVDTVQTAIDAPGSPVDPLLRTVAAIDGSGRCSRRRRQAIRLPGIVACLVFQHAAEFALQGIGAGLGDIAEPVGRYPVGTCPEIRGLIAVQPQFADPGVERAVELLGDGAYAEVRQILLVDRKRSSIPLERESP